MVEKHTNINIYIKKESYYFIEQNLLLIQNLKNFNIHNHSKSFLHLIFFMLIIYFLISPESP